MHSESTVNKSAGRPLSAILTELAFDGRRDRIAIADLLAVMGDRALGALMFVFAFPNVIPTIPGTSAILGAPLVFLAAQLALGKRPWLPGFITRRSLARKDFAKLMVRAGPWLAKAENLLRPRLGRLVRPPAEYLVGGLCLALSIVLVLPIPFGNMLPALSLCLLSLGVLERDGVWVLLGCTVAVVAFALLGGLFYSVFLSGVYLLKSLWH